MQGKQVTPKNTLNIASGVFNMHVGYFTSVFPETLDLGDKLG